jgi:hypothetical protein
VTDDSKAIGRLGPGGPEAVDLSALRASPADRRRLEDAIVAAAGAELARRAAVAPAIDAARSAAAVAGDGPLALVARWAIPTLAAAAILAALSVAGLALASRVPETAAGTLVGALELPEPASTWLDEDRGPATSDLILAVQEDLP